MRVKRESEFLLFNAKLKTYKFKGVLLFIGLYLLSLLFAAIVTPFIFKSVLWWNKSFPSELSAYLVDKGFDSFFDRIRWIPIVIGFPWLLKVSALFSLRRLGVHFDWAGIKRFFVGLFVGVVTVGLFLWAFSFVNKLKFDPFSASFLGVIGVTLLSGLILGFLEEIVFRGFLLRVFYTAMTPLFAVTMTSLVFAYLHFKIPDFPFDNITWFSGLYVAWGFLVGIVETIKAEPLLESIRFLNLFLLSVFLCFSVLRWKRLGFAIGFHAGLVWVLLIYKKSIAIVDRHPTLWMGRGGVHDSLLVACLFLILIALLWLLPKRS